MCYFYGFLNYHINLVGTTWRCTAWAFVNNSPKGKLEHCYATLNNWDLSETKDWQIFDNQSYRFVFKYPSSWTLSMAQGVSNGMSKSTIVGVQRENEVGVTFYATRVSYEQVLSQRQDYYNVIDQKEMVIDGKRAIRTFTVIKLPAPPYEDRELKRVDYVIEKGKDYLDGIELYESDLNKSYKLTDNDIQEFDLMMKTLNLPD